MTLWMWVSTDLFHSLSYYLAVSILYDRNQVENYKKKKKQA